MRRSLRILIPAVLASAAIAIGADLWRSANAKRATEIRRIAESHCGVCHRAIGDWGDIAPAAPDDLRRLMSEAAAFDMPPSPWHRARLAAHLEALR